MKMEVLDATSLVERLNWEDKEYWLHVEADSPLEKYPAKQHARRVQEKMGVEKGLIYLMGQPARNNEDSDMPAPFRQRRYFYYLSGCNEAGCHLTYDIRQDTLSLFIPRIDPKRVFWNGRGSTPSEALDIYDVDQVLYADELEDYIDDWASYRGNRNSDLCILHPYQLPPGVSELDTNIDSKSLQPAMNLARMIKDDHEIELIRKANDISSKAHREVLANILNFKNEAEVEGLFVNVCISHQAKQQAYDPIAASGPNAGTLHYDANNEDFGDRQVLCLDAGCEHKLYASDITRTFPLSAHWPSKEALSIHNLVQRMQDTCIKGLAPGVRYLDLHIRAHQIAIDGLLQLGILHNGSKEEIYRAGTSRAFFPHGLGHHVGLEVHDVGQAELMSVRRGKIVHEQAPSLYPSNFHAPVYDPKTCMAPTDPQSSHLEEGMVVTVEPGIYFSVYALKHFYLPSPIHSQYINTEVLERYLPVGGVRIEDDLLITSTGYENLTTAPKGDAMLDIIRSGHSGSINSPKRPTTATRKTNEEESPLMRAPGISKKVPKPIMVPLARASTMPAELKARKSEDFEPYNGPSLFTNFKRSMTTDENAQRWRQQSKSKDETMQMGYKPSKPMMKTPTTGSPPSVCGESSSNLQHVYLSSALGPLSEARVRSEAQGLPPCKNCQLLVQTLDRLRQNLNSSSQPSPTQATSYLEKREETPPQLPNESQDHRRSMTTLARAQTFPSNVLAPHSSTRMSPNKVAPQPPARRSPEALIRRKSEISGQTPLMTTKKSVSLPQDLKSFASAGPDHQTPTSITRPTPKAEDPYELARQQELDSLKLRLKSLEEQARLKARRHENSIRFKQRPSAGSSLPILRSDRAQQQPKEYTKASRSQTMPSP